MPIFTALAPETVPIQTALPPEVLGSSVVIDLALFPELAWISGYLSTLNQLHQEDDRLSRAIQAIHEEGLVYQDCWIEPYTKSKNGKHYTYHQLRWLTGKRKPSGQPQVKTRHLSHRTVAEARAAVARGTQIQRLQQQRRAITETIAHLKDRVQGTQDRLYPVCSQNWVLDLP